MTNKFDSIRPFHDSEVNAALLSVMDDPMMQAIMRFTFPNMPDEHWQNLLRNSHSIFDFQSKAIYNTVMRVLETSSAGLTTSGFEKLDPKKSYLFISNHRDILLDTSLLNTTLLDFGLIMTASAIGDNLVTKPFLYTLSKLNRNFLVRRGLAPRELLQSSKLMSEYIHQLVTQENRSVWLAQREGRTKDGNDATHTGVLKMLSMACEGHDLTTFFKEMNIVPISISYEYDPTDSLKIPELLANRNKKPYIKTENEDFNTVINGITGQKKRIHMHIGDVLTDSLEVLSETNNTNVQIKLLTQLIDKAIVGNYKLWATNYIAYDLLNNTNEYASHYTQEEKEYFVKRMERKVIPSDAHAIEHFLEMYANPVKNKAVLS